MSLSWCTVILGSLASSFLTNSITATDLSDIYLNTPQLIKKYGYPAESHEVVTEDGYILTMHRIPYSSKSPPALNKPAVFLQHGFLTSSADWVVLGPNNSLGYLLADEGYDVWMGNCRGNTYSRKHKTISSNDDNFWDFSFHECGMYDLPAEIDYVLNKTNQNSLYCMGMSMGNTNFFIMASERPEYNNKMKVMAAGAPFVLLHENSGSITTSASAMLLAEIIESFGFKVILPYEWPQILLARTLCGSRLTRFLCSMMLHAVAGNDPGGLNEDQLPIIVAHLSGGISVKTVVHAYQNMKAGKFQKYDYLSSNIGRYNQGSPPEYNMSAVTAPVALYYGQGDTLVVPEEVIKLNTSLGNCILLYKIPEEKFSHYGFTYGKHTKTLFNDKVIQLFKMY